MLADCPSKESVRQLGQLMCLNGFITDPTHAGVDRITVTCPRPDIGMVSPFSISADQISEDYNGHDILAAHGLIYCKGWLRCVTANLLMLFAYDYPHFLQAAVSFEPDLYACRIRTGPVTCCAEASL